MPAGKMGELEVVQALSRFQGFLNVGLEVVRTTCELISRVR